MSTQEDEYFAREEIEQKRKLALQRAEELAAKQREELKALHFMKCPKCGMDLQELDRGSVKLDMCFSCRGIWLDEGELDAILEKGQGQGGSVMRAVLNIFGRK